MRRERGKEGGGSWMCGDGWSSCRVASGSWIQAGLPLTPWLPLVPLLWPPRLAGGCLPCGCRGHTVLRNGATADHPHCRHGLGAGTTRHGHSSNVADIPECG